MSVLCSSAVREGAEGGGVDSVSSGFSSSHSHVLLTTENEKGDGGRE